MNLNQQLIEAAKNNDLELCKTLIQQGAYCFNWVTRIVTKYNHIEIIELMLKHGANNFNEIMCHAALYGHIEIVKLMIIHGATNFKDVICLTENQDIFDLLNQQLGKNKCLTS